MVFNLLFRDEFSLLQGRGEEIRSFCEDVFSTYVYKKIDSEKTVVDANAFSADTKILITKSFEIKRVDPFVQVATDLEFDMSPHTGGISVMVIVTLTPPHSASYTYQ